MRNSLKASLCILVLGAVALGVEAQDNPRKDLVLRGDAQCTRCHDAEDSPAVLAIGHTSGADLVAGVRAALAAHAAAPAGRRAA